MIPLLITCYVCAIIKTIIYIKLTGRQFHEYWRYSMGLNFSRIGDADDPGFRFLLRRHGSQKEFVIHHHVQLCNVGINQYPMGIVRV